MKVQAHIATALATLSLAWTGTAFAHPTEGNHHAADQNSGLTNSSGWHEGSGDHGHGSGFEHGRGFEHASFWAYLRACDRDDHDRDDWGRRMSWRHAQICRRKPVSP